MSDARGGVILVTGATDGLGKGVALELARRGTAVLLHGRRKERLEATRRQVSEETGGERPGAYLADLSSLAEVRALAARVSSDHDRLSALVNNAGLISADRRESEDGFELTFAVNYLAHFLLTNLLLPLLRGPSRIVSVASAAQSPLDFDDVMLERGYDAMRAYSQSKLAQVMFTFSLAERLQDTGVTANALHPASLMDTKMVRETFGYTMSAVEEGAKVTARLVVSPELEGVTGRYFDGRREGRANRQASDPEARRRLWTLSEELCGSLLDPSPERSS
jgi:NAD(P)-dependent dehydrogenase (short-subunit alcohol dehydrogenase family)